MTQGAGGSAAPPLSPALRAVCEAMFAVLPESAFRVDVSSTELRERAAAEVAVSAQGVSRGHSRSTGPFSYLSESSDER